MGLLAQSTFTYWKWIAQNAICKEWAFLRNPLLPTESLARGPSLCSHRSLRARSLRCSHSWNHPSNEVVIQVACIFFVKMCKHFSDVFNFHSNLKHLQSSSERLAVEAPLVVVSEYVHCIWVLQFPALNVHFLEYSTAQSVHLSLPFPFCKHFWQVYFVSVWNFVQYLFSDTTPLISV